MKSKLLLMKIPWHDGIIFKLKTYSVEGELLSPLKNYLENREQRIILNDQTSEWRKIMSGIPQGSVLLLCKMFVYDTSLFSKVYDIINQQVNIMMTLKREVIGLISGKCSLIQILTNRQIKLFSLEKQVQIIYHIHLSNLTIMIFLNVPIKST